MAGEKITRRQKNISRLIKEKKAHIAGKLACGSSAKMRGGKH